ncbi:MAG: hypothetical protein AAB434_04130 [Planctomycetota bacterium]
MESKTSPTTFRTLTPEQQAWITSEGRRIFNEKVSEAERRQHHGQYVAIDVVDGRFAFGATQADADDQLLPLPRGHFIFMLRIGIPNRFPRSVRL